MKQKYYQLSLSNHVTFLIPTLSPKLYVDPVNIFQGIYEHRYMHIEVYKLFLCACFTAQMWLESKPYLYFHLYNI